MPGADTPGRHRLPYADLDQRSVGRRVASLRDQDVVEPLPTITHQQAARRVANLIEQALPDLLVVEAVAVRLAPDVEVIPDVAVTDERPVGSHLAETPILVVEVLSPGREIEETVLLSAEYLRYGVGQYWILDPVRRTLDVFENDGGSWRHLVKLDDDQPEVAVNVGVFGTVKLGTAGLLGGS